MGELSLKVNSFKRTTPGWMITSIIRKMLSEILFRIKELSENFPKMQKLMEIFSRIDDLSEIVLNMKAFFPFRIKDFQRVFWNIRLAFSRMDYLS